MAEEVKVPNRWIFVIAGFIINLCLGTIYAWSVFRPPLHKAPYNLTPFESTIPFSVFLLVFGVTFAFSGRMVGKVGPKKPALIGAVCLGIGYLLSYSIAMAPTAALYITIVTFGLIAGTGCGYAYNPPIATVGRWFPDKRGLALGLTVMGFGLSALITAPAVVYLRDTYGIANTFLILGVVFLILMFLLGSLLKFPPAEWKAPPVPPSTAKKAWVAASVDFETRQMIKTNTFYVTWLIFLVGAGAGLMVIGNAAQIAADVTGLKGELAWMATLAVQILAIANACGRPIMGKVCDMIGPRNTLFIMLILQLICLVALFPYATSAAVLYLAIVIFAAMFGAYLAVMPTLVSYFFGAKNVGPNYGLYLSAYGVGGVVLPMVMASVLGPKPTYQNYVTGFYVTAGFIIVGLILAFIMRPPPRPT
ncbi:MAG: OFA family MFS transporter [Candidatus Bathyarchaeia archaeon]